MDNYHYYEIAFNDLFVFSRVIRDHKLSKPLPRQILVILHNNGSQFNSSFSTFFEHDYLIKLCEELKEALQHCPLQHERDIPIISSYLDLFKVMPIPTEEMYADARDGMDLFWHYQSQLFSPDDLSFLYVGFVRNLFTSPKPYEMLKLSKGDEGVILYFDIDYQYQLMGEYSNAKTEGKFARSNSEIHWLHVLNLLETADDTYNGEIKQATDYSVILSN